MNIINQIISFFVEGFSGMTVGKKLWIIILVKLFIIFTIFKIFFFQDFLNNKFKSEQDKSAYVIEELTNTKK